LTIKCHTNLVLMWIIDPSKKCLLIYSLNEAGKYVGSKPFTPEDKTVQSILFSDFKLNLMELFDLY